MKALEALMTMGIVHDKQLLTVVDIAMAFGAMSGLDDDSTVEVEFTPSDIVAFMKKFNIKNETLAGGKIKLTISPKEGA